MATYTVTLKAVVEKVYEDIDADSAEEATSIAEELLAGDIQNDLDAVELKTKVSDVVMVEDDFDEDFDTEEVVQPYQEVTLGFGMREVVGPNATYNPVAAPRAPAYNPIR